MLILAAFASERNHHYSAGAGDRFCLALDIEIPISLLFAGDQIHSSVLCK